MEVHRRHGKCAKEGGGRVEAVVTWKRHEEGINQVRSKHGVGGEGAKGAQWRYVGDAKEHDGSAEEARRRYGGMNELRWRNDKCAKGPGGGM